jgi:hypothetical protein
VFFFILARKNILFKCKKHGADDPPRFLWLLLSPAKAAGIAGRRAQHQRHEEQQSACQQCIRVGSSYCNRITTFFSPPSSIYAQSEKGSIDLLFFIRYNLHIIIFGGFGHADPQTL